jgi:vitamin B12 transporter
MKRLISSLAALSAAVSACPAHAAGDDDPSRSTVREVVITATRLPEPVDLVPGARVIDQEQIQATGAVFASDALKTVPGLSVFQTGAFGGVTSVRMRGASADKTLVLVDGVPVDDASQPAGNFDFGGFDLADVKRIEILSGPQGSLWGSTAIGGVISFTTREPDGLQAFVEGGSYRTARGSVSVGHADDHYALGLSASAVSTGGISSADAADGNPEKDGFHTQTVGGNARINPADGVVLDAKLRWSSGESGIDGFPAPAFALGDTTDTMHRESWSGLVRATIDGPWGLRHTFSASAYRIDRSDKGPSGDFGYDADRRVWRWQAERAQPSERFGVVVGAEREDDRAALSDGTRQKSGTTSAFAVGRYTPASPLTVTASLRWDDADHYRAVTTGRAAAVLDLGHGFSLNGSWGQGFKTPTISETACDFCFPAGPALDLKPERAEGWDGGIKWRSDDRRFSASLTGYRLAVRDQIDFTFDPLTFAFRYHNLERTRSTGTELEGSADLGQGFSVQASWSHTQAIDVSTELQLLRVPKDQGAASLYWTSAKAHAALTVRAEGTQSDAGNFGTQIRPGFVTADLAGGWRLNDKVEATLRLVNVGDAHWQEALGYGEPRRSAYLGLRLRY